MIGPNHPYIPSNNSFEEVFEVVPSFAMNPNAMNPEYNKSITEDNNPITEIFKNTISDNQTEKMDMDSFISSESESESLRLKSKLGKRKSPEREENEVDLPTEAIQAFKKKRLNPIQSIDEQWTNLKKETDEVMASIQYSTRNLRFRNVMPPIHTLVGSGGLNANVVSNPEDKAKIVASQAPLGIEQDNFWKAIYEDEYTIFDLTTQKDRSYPRMTEKVISYYPEKQNATLKRNKISIRLINEQSLDDMVKAEYEVAKDQDLSSKLITRYYYSNWPDHNGIEPEKLDRLVELIKTLRKQDKNVWIHCRAGVGRTGTLITASLLKEKIQSGMITEESFSEDLKELIKTLRQRRGAEFVQNSDQFKALFAYGNYLFDQMDTEES